MAFEEAAVAVGAPAVERDAVGPGADVEATPADSVRRHPIGDGHGGVGVLGSDQPVDAIEERPMIGRDGIDVGADGVVHGSAQPVKAGSAVTAPGATAEAVDVVATTLDVVTDPVVVVGAAASMVRSFSG